MKNPGNDSFNCEDYALSDEEFDNILDMIIRDSLIMFDGRNYVEEDESIDSINERFRRTIGSEFENECSICKEQMTPSTIAKTNCKHKYHRRCITVWFRVSLMSVIITLITVTTFQVKYSN